MKLPSIGSIVSFPFKHPIAFATIVVGTTLVVQAVASLYLTEQEEQSEATLLDRHIEQGSATQQLSNIQEEEEKKITEREPSSPIHAIHSPVTTSSLSLPIAGQLLASARVRLHPSEAALTQIKEDIANIQEEVRRKSLHHPNRKEVARLEEKKGQLLEQKSVVEAQAKSLRKEVEKLERVVNQLLEKRPKSS